MKKLAIGLICISLLLTLVVPTVAEDQPKLSGPLKQSEFNLETAINKMPEVYTKQVSGSVVKEYKKLISNLPKDAQQWITGMGQFLEDRKLSKSEKKLLELLASTKDPLIYLTSPRIMDGIWWNDTRWVKKDPIKRDGYIYLKDDVKELQERGLFSKKAKQDLDRIVGLSEDNYEIRKGLYLINNFGHPNRRMFRYKVPDFNTQLFILGKLLERGVPQDYERVSVAASLAYGSVYTIADEEVKALVPGYAYEMVKLIEEIDNSIKKKTDWQAKDYPLEADIGLIWGAPSVRYWTSPGMERERFWSHFFKTKPMGIEDFRWLFVETDTLRDMNKWMVQKGFVDLSIEDPAIDKRHITDKLSTEYNEKIDKIMADLNDYLYFGEKHFTGNPDEIVNVEGREVFAAYIRNPDWQWQHFIEYGYFYGTCMEDTATENMFAKTINVASHDGFTYAKKNTHTHTHTIIYYYNPFDKVLRTTPCQVYFYYKPITPPGAPLVSHDGHVPVPWQNFRYHLGWQRFHQRSHETHYTIYAKGFPVGYIFRSYFGSHPFS